MIPRTLVPEGARLSATADTATQRRRPTTLDERTLVPAMLPIIELDGKSSIPRSLPLESIAARVVVPRDVNQEAYNVKENTSTPVQPTDMDERIAVPQGGAPLEMTQGRLIPPADIVDLDVFMTGEVNLLTKPQTEEKTKSDLITRVSSFAFHILLFATIILWAKIFPPHAPTKDEIDLANRQLTWIPPESSYAPKPKAEPRPAQPPAVRVDPRVINKVAPPVPQPAPRPEPPKRELPDAPAPKVPVTPHEVEAPAPKPDAPKPPLKLDTPDMPKPQHGLVLPKAPTIEDTVQDMSRAPSSGSRPIGGGGRVSGRSSPGGGGSGGTAYGGLEMLTPDQGVDFNSYLQRVYVTVKRNWFAIMPESVELGERGVVVLTFKIMRDGSVPNPEPVINRNSGKEPLDRAAYSSVRASNPFEPLPSQFTGPYIELRYTYLYNIPPESYSHQQ
ncbi:MAG TPA: energy transducer TonB [Candidatus Acidoferrum sp.]|jgi:outer membrane biosynthesis protein TonB|nr:energy transducer TonB [Candidatus Acidoferrum sp.]